MTATIPASVDLLRSADRDLPNQAFSDIIEATNEPVTWAYDVWDDVFANLQPKDNHNRAIAAQVLCNLAKSYLQTGCKAISTDCLP